MIFTKKCVIGVTLQTLHLRYGILRVCVFPGDMTLIHNIMMKLS